MSSIGVWLRRILADARGQRVFLALVIAWLYWLYGWRPFVIQTWAVVDDGLYVRHATAFLDWLRGTGTRWLGPFDSYLLAKVPLYGIWLATLNILGLPLRVGEFLLFLTCGFLFRRAVRPVRLLVWWEFAFVLFLLLANPLLPFDFFLHRLSFHAALTDLCLIAAVGLALRAGAVMRARLLWALLLGFLFSLCYLNREEAIWVVVVVFAAFMIVGAVSLLACHRGDARWRPAVRGLALAMLAFLVGALPLILAVCTLNKVHYGAFITTFRRSSAFTGLYQRLTSLEPAGHRAYIPIARSTRLKAYELSPTFAKLQPFLEGQRGYWHAGNAEHSAMNGHKPEEQEFFVSYFEFSLVWAATESGAKRADEVEVIFRSIDRELAQAVRQKQIVAGASGPAVLAALIPGDYGRIAAAFWKSIVALSSASNAGYAWLPGPQAPRDHLVRAGELTHSWVEVQSQSSMQFSMRRPWILWMTRLQTVLYPLIFLSIPALILWRRKEVFTRRPTQAGLLLWTLVVPAVGLGAFCFSMAVVEVLCCKIIVGLYNMLGYAPITVLCACAFTCMVVFLRPQPPAGGQVAPVRGD